MTSRAQIAKDYFNLFSNYPDENFCIRIRKEVIFSYLQKMHFADILDVAAGNGEITLQFLEKTTNLTLIDISENMLKRSATRIPENLSKKVRFICGDINTIDLDGTQFDLVICTGLLAHIDSPFRTLEKLFNLVKKEGILIVQNTDGGHFYSRLIQIHLKLIKTFSKRKYQMNVIHNKQLLDFMRKNGYSLIKTYKSITSFLFISRIISNEFKYGFVKYVFGNVDKNKNKWLGNDIIYFMRKD